MADLPDSKKLRSAADQVDTAKQALDNADELEARARDARIRASAESRIAHNTLGDAGVRVVDGFDLGADNTNRPIQPAPAVVERDLWYREHPLATGAALIAILALLLGLAALIKGNDSTGANNAIAQANKANSVAVTADAKADRALDTAKQADSKADKALEKATEAQAAASTCNACCCEKKGLVARKHRPAPKKHAVIAPQPVPPVVVPPAPLVQAPPPASVFVPEKKVETCTKDCRPEVTLERKVPRTDGRCVVAFKDPQGAVHYARFDTKRGTSLLVGAKVDDATGEWNRTYTPTYVGYIDGDEKKTVELKQPYSCASVFAAISQPKVLAWTGPRLGLVNCTPFRKEDEVVLTDK